MCQEMTDHAPFWEAKRSPVLTGVSGPRAFSPYRPILCICACVLLFLAGAHGVALLQEALNLGDGGLGLSGRPGLLIAVLVIYAVLIAIPFVPGAELGFFLLMFVGRDMAVPLYLATVLSLMLAYGIGHLVPLDTAIRFLKGVLPARPAAWFEHKLRCSAREFRGGAHAMAGCPTVRSRCLALAVVFNMPGNSVLGGGGGIALMSGVARVLDPLRYLLTVALAVSPVPLAVLLFGAL